MAAMSKKYQTQRKTPSHDTILTPIPREIHHDNIIGEIFRLKFKGILYII